MNRTIIIVILCCITSIINGYDYTESIISAQATVASLIERLDCADTDTERKEVLAELEKTLKAMPLETKKVQCNQYINCSRSAYWRPLLFLIQHIEYTPNTSRQAAILSAIDYLLTAKVIPTKKELNLLTRKAHLAPLSIRDMLNKHELYLICYYKKHDTSGRKLMLLERLHNTIEQILTFLRLENRQSIEQVIERDKDDEQSHIDPALLDDIDPEIERTVEREDFCTEGV